MERVYALLDKKVPLKALIIPFLIGYICWELYWCITIGYPFIKWHTHLMPYLILGMLGIFGYRLVSRRVHTAAVKNVFLVFASVLFSLFIAEAFLAVSGMTSTYMEQVNGYYVSPYTPQDRSYYHTWGIGTEHWLTKPEYSFWRPTNSLGFPDAEWPLTKGTKEKRILALGDSFTEGDGAPFDSSYVSLLRRQLQLSGDSFYVMNAGVCGSDPANNYMILKDRLPAYRPDIIIQSLGSGDMIDDIYIRGGLERFQRDGSVRYRDAPWWEPLFAGSYVSRLFFKMAGYTELQKKGGISASDQQRIDQQANEIFARYMSLCRDRGIRLFIVLHPERGEIGSGHYHYDFSSVLSHLSGHDGVTILDLLPSYRSYLQQSHTAAAEYFWQHDGHHNSKGYKMMAETTLQNIRPLLMDSVPSQ